MRILSSLALAAALCAALAAPASAASHCNSLEGAAALTAAESIDFIVLGEAHGTVELPALFADLVCAALPTGRAVIVGVEHGEAHQLRLDAYMASDGDAAARAALTADPRWSSDDARFTVAMADLIERIRALKASGADIRLAAFDEVIDQPGTTAAREEGMARRLIRIRDAAPGSLVLALTGLGHADTNGFASMTPPIPSMAQHLPQASTLTLAFVRSGGTRWGCPEPAPGEDRRCGPVEMVPRDPPTPRGVVVGDDRPGFDAVASTGGPLTASPPAAR